MADPIDTGPGGFDIDGKTYTYDVGESEASGGEQGSRGKTVNVSAGYLDESGNPKDLTKKTKTTLAQYLGDVTTGKKGSAKVSNRYPVTANTVVNRSITQNDGSPLGPTPVGQSSSKNFGAAVNPYSEQYPILEPHLRKGKETLQAQDSLDGNDFLKSKTPGTANDPTPIGRYQSAVLANNRFSPVASDRFEDENISAAGFNPSFTKQTTKGSYNPDAETVTVGRLTAIGPLLTMRAGKELGAADPGADPNSGGLQAQAILPGLGQLGLSRIDQAVLLASDVLADLTQTDDAVEPFLISPGGASWGQLNNVNDPYNGTNALGMLALSTALVAGVEVLFDGLSLLLGLITPSLKKPARDAQGRYSLGEYLPGSKDAKKTASGGIGGAFSAVSSLNFGALLGIQPTNFPFSRALTTGMNAFFGIPDSTGGGIGLNQLAGAVSSSVDSPGFNVVVARSIIRSGVTIVDQLKKIGGNPMNAITQILALIDTIRSSKLVSACNIFASLGDAVLSNPSDFVDKDSAKTKTSLMDSKNDIDGNAVSKNRLKGTLKLAWAGNRAPSNVLLPASIFAASLSVKNLGQFNSSVGLRLDPYSRIKSTVTVKNDMGRIRSEDAYKFEDALEASYVPFYFHDVRTNEMIGFHAFLASLTDDYTANYEKSEGFGRVEAVKIYKGTERRIGMSFYVVATSPSDFDEMYIKINKLVTLVYPQYTSGVQLQNKDKDVVFTQPFSQLVGASPLIRIRLGDLLRSNYSLFALGRLFGMGGTGFKLDGEEFTAGDTIDQAVIDDYTAKIQSLLADPVGKKFLPTAGTTRYEYFPDPGPAPGGFSIPIPKIPGSSNGADGPKYAPEFDPGNAGPSSPFVVIVKKLHPDNPLMVIGEVQFNDDIGHSENASVGSPGLKKWVDENFNNDKLPLQKYIGGTYVFPLSALTPTGKTLNDVVSKVSALASLNGDSDFGQKLAEFLSPKTNAIAKSFQDTGGKGLAGFIESMNFDWYDKVTWETDKGRIAPKMCKVTLTFSPIHDISPGIDHHGFNRAPIYPVGSMQQGQMPYQKADE